MTNESVQGSVRITVVDWRARVYLIDESIYLGDFTEDPTSLLCRTNLTKYAQHFKVVTTYLERDTEEARATHLNVVKGAMSDSNHWT